MTTNTHMAFAHSKVQPRYRINWKIVRYAILIVFAFLYLAPLLLVLSASLKTPQELQTVLSLPSGLDFTNYVEGWRRIGPSIINSIYITIPAVALSILVGAMAAYPLSHVRIPGGKVIFLLLLAGMLVPHQVVQIPLFLMMRALGLYNTIPGMWLVHVAYGVPFCTFFLRNFFSTIPKSMFEAAQIDGCGAFGYFFKILLPASISGISALAIVQSRAVWNDLFFGLTLTNSAHTQPMPVALYGLIGGMEVEEGPLMAATIISMLPVMIAFLIFQKSFTRGLLGGADK